MKKALRIILPILLVLVILASAAWYFLKYDPGFTQELLLRRARNLEEGGNHTAASRYYDLAYRLSGNNDDVAIELAQRFKAIGNYTKAEQTLSGAIADGATVELYIALSQTYVEQDKLLDAVTLLDNVADPALRDALEALRPAAPTADVAPGFYSQYLTVTITAETGTLYLTATDTCPSMADRSEDGLYPLPAGETTVSAVAVGENGLVSKLSIFGYTVGGVIEEVSFADPAVEQAVREALNVGEETVLYTNDLWTLTEFTVPEDTESLADLAKLPYLTSLTVSGKDIGDGAFLSAMVSLKDLTVTGTAVSSEALTAIGALAELERLTLSDCQLSNIDALAGCASLKALDLSNNAVRNLEALSGLANLQELYLAHNALNNLAALSGLSNLSILDVSYNALTTPSPIGACASLTRLDLSHNSLRSLDTLGSLSNLAWLNAAANSITSLSVLAPCAALAELNVSANAITDLSVLLELPALMRLDFSGNQVESLPEFAVDCALTTVDGSDNALTTIDQLGGLYNLNRVTMDNNPIASIDALADCPLLVQVSVFGTQVREVSALTDRSIIVHYDPVEVEPEPTEE